MKQGSGSGLGLGEIGDAHLLTHHYCKNSVICQQGTQEKGCKATTTNESVNVGVLLELSMSVCVIVSICASLCAGISAWDTDPRAQPFNSDPIQS